LQRFLRTNIPPNLLASSSKGKILQCWRRLPFRVVPKAKQARHGAQGRLAPSFLVGLPSTFSGDHSSDAWWRLLFYYDAALGLLVNSSGLLKRVGLEAILGTCIAACIEEALADPARAQPFTFCAGRRSAWFTTHQWCSSTASARGTVNRVPQRLCLCHLDCRFPAQTVSRLSSTGQT
jgi:hypothetical protein